MGRPIRVRLRDGREVPFDGRRVADDIYRASQSAGRDDRPLAEELADVVSLFLERRYDGRAVAVDDIQDMVEKVLLETGNAGPAKAYIVERERRQQVRPERGTPAPTDTPLFPEGTVLVDSPSRATATPWDRRKIAAALVVEARLEAAVAEDVAAGIERRIFAAGVTRVTTRVVRELVSGELFARGLARPLAEQGVVGLPRYDLRAILTGGGHGSPTAVARAVEQAALGQYALEEIFSPEVSRAHTEGVLHVHGVGTPLRLHALHVAPGVILHHGVVPPGGPPLAPPAAAARDITEALPAFIQGLAPLVSGTLDLGDLAGPYAAVTPDPALLADEARRAMRVLAGTTPHFDAIGADLSLNLAAPPPEAGSLAGPHALATAGLAAAWASLVEGPGAAALPRLTVHVTDDWFGRAPLREALRTLCRVARLGRGVTFAFDRDGGPFQLHDRYCSRARDAAELRHAGGPRLAVLQAVTVNCVRAALEAPRRDEDAFFAELERGVALALGAARERRAFGKRMAHAGGPLAAATAPGPDGRPLVDLDRSHVLLGLVGLAEAVATVLGPAPREDAWIRTESRVASFVYFKAAEEARAHGFGLSFDDDVPVGVRARLRGLDAERFGASVPAGPYGQGLVLPGSDPHDLLEAVRRRASLHALVDPRVTIRGLARTDGEGALLPDVAFDMVCEVHQQTPAVFLRFA